MTRGASIIAAAFAWAVVAFVVPATANADQPPPGNEPGVAQYQETVPTAGGGEAVGSNTKTHKLSPTLQAKLKREGGRAAASLAVIASSAAYGAPQTKLKTATTPVQTRTTPTTTQKRPAVQKPSVASTTPTAQNQAAGASGNQGAASAAATSAGHGYVLALVLVLVVLTAGAVAGTVWRRRRRSA